MISKGLPIHKLPPLFRSMQEEKTKYGDKLFMNETAKGKLFRIRSLEVSMFMCMYAVGMLGRNQKLRSKLSPHQHMFYSCKQAAFNLEKRFLKVVFFKSVF